MIAFYTMGAGLGHLSRTLKVIQTLSIEQPCLLLTNSQFTDQNTQFSELLQEFNERNISFIQLQPKTLSLLTDLTRIISDNGVTELYIDCFPVGIYGELNGLKRLIPSVKLNLLARLLKWSDYKSLIKEHNHFEYCYRVESLAIEQLQYIKNHSDKISRLALPSLSFSPIENKKNLPVELFKQDYCLVVHSGNCEEVSQLLNYTILKLRLAKLPYAIVLASPHGVPEEFLHHQIKHIYTYPLKEWLIKAQVVVSGAGFNIVNEVSTLNKKSWLLPFTRKYDDQFARLIKLKEILPLADQG